MNKSTLILIVIIFLAALLRLFSLSHVPPALNWDESALGYNAYSISETLRDEHGEFLPLSRFISFGDYKPPLYIYAAALSVKVFGLNDFSVRIPSALAGTLLILVTYFLTKELVKLTNTSPFSLLPSQFGLIAAFLLAISPWALQFSRGAFEANLATLLSGSGILFFLRGIRLRSIWMLILSSIFFAFSMYTFNSHRIFVPLMILALGLIFARQLLSKWKIALVSFAFFALLLIPLLPHMLSREGKLRFNEVTWLNDLDPIKLSNQRIAADQNSLLGKVIHNRRLVYAQQFLKHYTDHFRADFLFFSGDVNPRLSIQSVGELYWIELPFLLAGLFFFAKNRSKSSALIFSWLLLAPIPAAFARETPHALRILNILPLPQVIIATGLVYLVAKWRRVIPAFACLFLLLSCYLYLHNYYIHYPKTYAVSWQFGYKEMVQYVRKNESKYDFISVTEKYGRPYIYLLFYSSYPPEKYWQTVNRHRDWYGFWYVNSFDKFHFGDKVGSGRQLFIRGAKGTPNGASLLKTIYSPTGEPLFEISEIQ